ncbi:hypothetical protein NIES4074_59030 [Cylindrospermum sp. NIES-4074]|nr:hypothetical protein NIES4074_59030 [Cylindrospermum sp. NIES-4074]
MPLPGYKRVDSGKIAGVWGVWGEGGVWGVWGVWGEGGDLELFWIPRVQFLIQNLKSC